MQPSHLTAVAAAAYASILFRVMCLVRRAGLCISARLAAGGRGALRAGRAAPRCPAAGAQQLRSEAVGVALVVHQRVPDECHVAPQLVAPAWKSRSPLKMSLPLVQATPYRDSLGSPCALQAVPHGYLSPRHMHAHADFTAWREYIRAQGLCLPALHAVIGGEQVVLCSSYTCALRTCVRAQLDRGDPVMAF